MSKMGLNVDFMKMVLADFYNRRRSGENYNHYPSELVERIDQDIKISKVSDNITYLGNEKNFFYVNVGGIE